MRRARRKAFGAYDTDDAVAQYLLTWALAAPGARVLDPGFGGGVFLRAALARLGGSVGSVTGVELDGEAYVRVQAELAAAGAALDLYCADFFALTPQELGVFDAVVGNPPFIRAARLTAESRARALARAAAQGVRLSKAASAWAPFVVHAGAFVKPGGRLAMVVPAELGHAAYARPVLAYLTRSFAEVTLLFPRRRLFPALDQETLLLLAAGRGEASRTLGIAVGWWPPSALPLRRWNGWQRGGRLAGALLPQRVSALYQTLAAHPEVKRLGALAEVGIGYVSGANRFFHLSPDDAVRWGLPPEVLRPAVWRSRALAGLRLRAEDWAAACAAGTAGYLLDLNGKLPSPAVARYLAHGEALGLAQGYKVRERRCWYAVPNVKTPDALLAVMGSAPPLVVNEARVVVPNTLHAVRLYAHAPTSALGVSLGWQTSLTRLSLELEGHALGGGMLKLEPAEARQVLVALPDARALACSEAVDTLLRAGREEAALELADRVILQEGLGLTRQECRYLREGWRLLREHRLRR